MTKNIIVKILSPVMAFMTMFAMLTPTFALAHGTDDANKGITADFSQRIENHSTVNQYGVHVFDGIKSKSTSNNNEDKNKDKDKDNDKGLHLGRLDNVFPALFYRGTVTATSSTGFTIESKDNKFFTVVATGATIIRIPRTVISLSDVAVGDRVSITGTKTSSGGVVINASVVYDLSQNLKPAVAKGTVTATTANTLTIQSDVANSTPFTANVNADTQVVTADHAEGTLADVTTGSTVKVVGFWDNVLNVFNAIKIKLF